MAPSRPQRKKGRQAVRNNQGGFPGWGWAIIGLLGGALLMWFFVLHRSPQPQGPVIGMTPKADPNAVAAASSDPGMASTAPPPPKKPQYDFYSVLPEKDVRIPDAELSAKVRAEQQSSSAPAGAANAQAQTQPQPPRATALPASVQPQSVTPAPAAATASSGPESYLLQIGAFPNSGDAEALKAKLAMQGFVANVQNVTINGQAYHRVRLGPFASATQLESTKQRLSAAGIHAIALKEGR
ncbi:SPOR domain-containing protein [Frateuria aurantia]